MSLGARWLRYARIFVRIFVLVSAGRTSFACPLDIRITRSVYSLSCATGGLVGASVTFAVLVSDAHRVTGSICAVGMHEERCTS